jgi:hypothetical protein
VDRCFISVMMTMRCSSNLPACSGDAPPSIYDAAITACKILKISSFASTNLTKDMILLVCGVRVSVLIDYFSSRTMLQDLHAVISKAKSVRKEFCSLRVAKICEGNFILMHIHNCSLRLCESLKCGLSDVIFVECSAGLRVPEFLKRETIDSQLLPNFQIVHSIVLDAAKSSLTCNSEIDLGGERLGSPLPTLAGWLLEYPVIYYLDSATGALSFHI